MKPPLTSSLSRRAFVKGSAATVAAVGTLEISHSAHAAGSDEIKIALVGCGGRGTGAAANALLNKTHSNIRLIAAADAFAEPLERAVQDLQKQFGERVDVPPERRFVGLDAYEKAIAAGADVVLLCTPPGFRPAQFAAAVKAGKNVFMEKPVAVDAPGYRVVKAANAEAKAKRLYVAVGHHLRHDQNHAAVVRQIHDGLIGDLLFTRAYFNTQGIWNRPRKPGMTEMQYQVNNWYHFVWLSGDHNVEQHVHGIDVCNWLAKGAPAQATGIGGRQVRAEPGIGEIFDHHCVQYTYGDGSYSFSECRQQSGCWSNFSHHAHGTKGSVSFDGGDAVTIELRGAAPKRLKPGPDGHQTEWDDFLAALVSSRPYNEADSAADSTLTAILGRMATYSGKLVTWEEAVKSTVSYGPERLAWDATPRSKPGADGIYPCAVPGVTQAF
jgi:myo-inositol 2-dehydrogenase / D-chiro-inositol 1-dehydrogenase